MNTNSLCRWMQHQAFLEKLAQEEDEDSGLLRAAEGLAVPAMAGIGGYGLARMLGQQKWTGLPDWLVGPTFGIGVGVPAYRGVKSLIRRIGRKRQDSETETWTKEQQAALEQEIANQMAMEQQSRAMLEQAVLGGMGSQQAGAGKMKRAATGAGEGLSVPMDQVDAYYQQIAQQQAQKAQQAQQQQMQQAAVAQMIRGQFRGLQEQQRQQSRQMQQLQQQSAAR